MRSIRGSNIKSETLARLSLLFLSAWLHMNYKILDFLWEIFATSSEHWGKYPNLSGLFWTFYSITMHTFEKFERYTIFSKVLEYIMKYSDIWKSRFYIMQEISYVAFLQIQDTSEMTIWVSLNTWIMHLSSLYAGLWFTSIPDSSSADSGHFFRK